VSFPRVSFKKIVCTEFGSASPALQITEQSAVPIHSSPAKQTIAYSVPAVATESRSHTSGMRHRSRISERCKERSIVPKGIQSSRWMSHPEPNVQQHDGRGIRN